MLNMFDYKKPFSRGHEEVCYVHLCVKFYLNAFLGIPQVHATGHVVRQLLQHGPVLTPRRYSPGDCTLGVLPCVKCHWGWFEH